MEKGRGREAMGRGRWGGGNMKGEMGKWAKGWGRKRARGEGIMMKSLDAMRLQSFLTLFTRATPGTPASYY